MLVVNAFSSPFRTYCPRKRGIYHLVAKAIGRDIGARRNAFISCVYYVVHTLIVSLCVLLEIASAVPLESACCMYPWRTRVLLNMTAGMVG